MTITIKQQKKNIWKINVFNVPSAWSIISASLCHNTSTYSAECFWASDCFTRCWDPRFPKFNFQPLLCFETKDLPKPLHIFSSGGWAFGAVARNFVLKEKRGATNECFFYDMIYGSVTPNLCFMNEHERKTSSTHKKFKLLLKHCTVWCSYMSETMRLQLSLYCGEFLQTLIGLSCLFTFPYSFLAEQSFLWYGFTQNKKLTNVMAILSYAAWATVSSISANLDPQRPYNLSDQTVWSSTHVW